MRLKSCELLHGFLVSFPGNSFSFYKEKKQNAANVKRKRKAALKSDMGREERDAPAGIIIHMAAHVELFIRRPHAPPGSICACSDVKKRLDG